MKRRSSSHEPAQPRASSVPPRRVFCAACRQGIFADSEPVTYVDGRAYHPNHVPDGTAVTPTRPAPSVASGAARTPTASRPASSGGAIERQQGESEDDFRKRRRRERRAARKARG